MQVKRLKQINDIRLKVPTTHILFCQVHWDMGGNDSYNAGKGDKCDLRVLDSAPVGKL